MNAEVAPGNRILFVAGTHGDEGFGVEVMKAIEQTYDPDIYGYDWIVGNPNALAIGARYTDTDLNRSAPGDAQSAAYEERRAAEIIELSKRYDMMIDLHGTVANCGIVNIIAKPSPENIALARALPVARNVIWYSAASELHGPLAQHVKCSAIELECGPKSDLAVQRELEILIGRIIMANRAGQFEQITQTFYEVYGKVVGDWRLDVKDFQAITIGDETFYPFLSSQYEGEVCRKLRTVRPEDVIIINEK